jgi:hypothetical protein
MSSPPSQRKCRYCRRSYVPDHRNRYHQRYCSRPECQQTSKRSSHRRWLRAPANRDYFCGPEHVRRVQRWRSHHPHYWRAQALGSSSQFQPQNTQKTVVAHRPEVRHQEPEGGTLQDLCRLKSPQLMRLAAQLERGALQEDIAGFARDLITVGQCILERTTGRPEESASAYDAQPELPFEPAFSRGMLGCRHPEMFSTGAGPPAGLRARLIVAGNCYENSAP